MLRDRKEIAERALGAAAVSFRAGLEATDDPRSPEICTRLLPWLDELGIADGLEAVYREMLEAPWGELRAENRVEAFAENETAALLGWVLELLPLPPVARPADPRQIFSAFNVLRPDAQLILEGTTLRPVDEIDALYVSVMAMRLRFSQQRLDAEIGEQLERVYSRQAAELGMLRFDEALRRATELIAQMSADEQSDAMAVYVARGVCVHWLNEGEFPDVE